jgi:SAM-dependent methyltransferase
MGTTSSRQTEVHPVPVIDGMPTAKLGATVCPACGAAQLSVVALAERPILLGRCGACGLRWLLDAPTAAELAALYTSGFYEPAPARGGRLVGTYQRLDDAIRLRELRGLSPGRLLDVGCGKGRFLAAARDAGWEVRGVEFAPASAEAARVAYGIDVAVGDFLEVGLKGGFDAITMWHVLEHMPDPFAAVTRAADLLRPGGSLVISVPNIESLQARLGGEQWFHLDLPRHLMHFSPRSLSALVARTGLRLDRIEHFYPELETIGLVQTILNRVGIESDLLYRFAKRDPSAGGGPSVYASFALALAAAPAAVAWSMIAPLLRTGASIQLVAHRP